MKNLNYNKVEEIINDVAEEFLEHVSENCDDEGNINFGNEVNEVSYENKVVLLNDFIDYINCYKEEYS